jgi:hypothetical protein
VEWYLVGAISVRDVAVLDQQIPGFATAVNRWLSETEFEFYTIRGSVAAQLFAAADSRPFVGPALPRLVLRGFPCQSARHVKAASG